MLRFLRASELWRHPVLARSMYEERRKQPLERQSGFVNATAQGSGLDDYDALNPIYAIVESDSGVHQGSARFLPTTGPTMINDHFLDAMGGVPIKDLHVWECSRFCLSPTQRHITSLQLLAAGALLMKEFELKKMVAAFDDRIWRVCRLSGLATQVIGTRCYPTGKVTGGSWTLGDATLQSLKARPMIDLVEPILALENCNTFGLGVDRRQTA